MASRARSIRRLTSSTARLTGVRPSSRRESPDRRLGRGPFVPGLFPTTNENASFVPFAGEQDGIPGARAADRVRDPLPPILDARVLRALGPADLFGTGGNVAEDGHGILFARVFVGENGIVAQAGGNLAHPGPLLAVAVTRATEDRDQLPTRDGPQLAQDLLEALRRMRVIDDHAERLTEVDALHPAADTAVTLKPRPNLGKRESDGDTGRDRRQRVGGVPAAAQLQPQSQRPERCRSLHPQALRGRLDPLSLEIRIQLKPVRDPPGDGSVDEVCVTWVVAVEHCRFLDALAGTDGCQVDQLRLRLSVRLDRLVEIEVLVRDVRENCEIILDPQHALNGEPVRAGL